MIDANSENEKLLQVFLSDFSTEVIPVYARWCDYFWQNAPTDKVGEAIFDVIIGVKFTFFRVYSHPISFKDEIITNNFGKLISEIDNQFPRVREVIQEKYND